MEMKIEEILSLLPHRYPFILVDRVDEVYHGENKDNRVGAKIKARKNVTINEPYFTGHFPHKPVMPGVLQLEAMAQAGGLACYSSEKENSYELLIVGLQKARFRKPVVPGDTLILEAEVLKDRNMGEQKRMVVIACKATVDNEVASEVEVMAYIQPREVKLK